MYNFFSSNFNLFAQDYVSLFLHHIYFLKILQEIDKKFRQFGSSERVES